MGIILITVREDLGRTDYYNPADNDGTDPVAIQSVGGLSGIAVTDTGLGGDFTYLTAPGSGTRFTAGTNILNAANGGGVTMQHTFTGTSLKGVGTTIDPFSITDEFTIHLTCYNALDVLLETVSLDFTGGLVAGTAPYIGALSDDFDIAKVIIAIDPIASQLYFDDYDIVRSANAIGDPHFVGYNGESYDVMGIPNRFFNILSDYNVQCNAFFKECKVKHGRTHLETMGFKIGTPETGLTKIIYSAKEPPIFQDSIISKGFRQSFYSGIGSIKGEIRFDGETLRIDTGNYFFNLSREIEWHEQVIVLKSSINQKVGKINPHGILGQTANFKRKKLAKYKAKQGEGIIEGTFRDYRVKSLFDDSFIFNRFNTYDIKKRKLIL